MTLAEINTPLRQAAFLGQLGHESGELRWFEEFADGSAYEGRKSLGNIYVGDGKRYKGRGPIQLTGRTNYKKYGDLIGVDLENNPEKAKEPAIGFRVAAEYWRQNKLSALADLGPGSYDKITRAINGGLNGKAHRDELYRRARKILGVP
jgi:predicted chitinase